MIITNVILIWALNFINLGNYKSFSNFDNYINPIKISKNKAFVFDKENIHTIKLVHILYNFLQIRI